MADIEQRSPEWFAVRTGKFTGSKFNDAMSRSKKTGEPLKACTDLIWQVATERLTGNPVESYRNQAMDWGVEQEPNAKNTYEFIEGVSVVEVGFIIHPEYNFIGVSPDGLIGENEGGLEVKCPWNSMRHLERFIIGMPDEYKAQVQGCLWVTGREWWDFMSFDPRMPPAHQVYKERIYRDEDYIKDLQTTLLWCEDQVNELLEKLNGQN